ncbi:MAG TPA: permease, partial [Gammaproteobacteria bacterium]|nr:permease [Gammaproteobacteria bacterium]
MSAFVYSGVDLQLLHQVWLLPCAAIGHVMGLKVHQKLFTSTGNLFMRL